MCVTVRASRVHPTCAHLSADLGQARDRCLQRTVALRSTLRRARDTRPISRPDADSVPHATLRSAGDRYEQAVLRLYSDQWSARRPYVGVTNDLIRRLSEHKAKLVPGFTKAYGVVLLVYYEEYSSVLEARAREAALKRGRRAWKIALVDSFIRTGAT